MVQNLKTPIIWLKFSNIQTLQLYRRFPKFEDKRKKIHAYIFIIHTMYDKHYSLSKMTLKQFSKYCTLASYDSSTIIKLQLPHPPAFSSLSLTKLLPLLLCLMGVFCSLVSSWQAKHKPKIGIKLIALVQTSSNLFYM